MIEMEALRDIVFFRKLDEQEWAFLEEKQANYFHDFSDGHVLVQEGVRNNRLFVILEGRVVVTRGKSRTVVAELYRGDLFGEMAFLTGRVRTTSVLAASPLTVFVMSPEIFTTLPATIQVKMQTWIIATLVKRLDDLNALLSGITR